MINLREYKKKKYSGSEKSDYDGDDFEYRLKAHKRRMVIIGLSVIIALLISIVVIKIYIDHKVYDEYTVKKTIQLGDTYGCKFFGFGDFVLRYSNDGITYIDGKDTVWNQPFEMKNPLIDVCKNTVAIAEAGGTTVYIYNETGSLGQIATEYPIEKLDVASQGVVAVITKDAESNYIEVYDKDGNQLVAGRAVLTGETGYPMDISISDDGTKMVVTFLNVTGSVASTKVVFYNFTEIGKSEVDRIVGVFAHYGSSIIPKVEFISNNHVVAFGDDVYTVYSMKQKPSKIYEENISNEIKSIFYSEDYIGLVTKTDDIENPYNIKVVDIDGKTELEKTVSIDYTGIKMGKKNVILYNSTQLQVISFNGVVKYEGTFDNEISEVLVTDDKYTYLVVTGTGVEKIKLK